MQRVEDSRLPDNSVDPHGGPAPCGLIGGEVDDVVHEGLHGEAVGV